MYKHSRQELETWFKINIGFDSYAEKEFRKMFLAQKEDRKECKCSCHQINSVAFACTECQKNHPTPSPLEGFEEIDDIDWVTPAISKVELAKKFNWLNRNQKKLYQYIKSLKEKK